MELKDIKIFENCYFEDETTKVKTPITFALSSHYSRILEEELTDVTAEIFGVTWNVSSAVRHAVDHANRQNETTNERYKVKDLTLRSITKLKNGLFVLGFVWWDCYNCDRGYRGIECEADETRDGGFYLLYREPKWYF